MTDTRSHFHFDHHTTDFARDPWTVYRQLRSKCPVSYSDAYGGFWVLSLYKDIFDVARDDLTYSSNREVVIPATKVGRLIPLQADPPRLQLYRQLLTPFLTRHAVRARESRIREFTTDCIDGFIQTGRCDLVLDLANPVPAMTTLEIIGLPVADWHDYAEPIHANSYSHVDQPKNIAARLRIGRLRERVAAEVDNRRTRPREDMISHLVQAQARGEIDGDEVLDLVMMTIFGGVDTTMAALSNALLYLHRDRGARQRLIETPALLPTAIEEFLRHDAPVQGFARTVTKDVSIHGQQVAAGETVFMLWASANRDPAVFPDPDDVILHREPNLHLTFGVGGHFCLGSTVARTELRIVLEEVLRRLPDYSLQEDGIVEPDTIGIVNGKVKMPAVFTPGRREHTVSPLEGAESSRR